MHKRGDQQDLEMPRFGRLQDILQFVAFGQNRALRKIVGNRDNREQQDENAAENEQSPTQGGYQSGIRPAPPESPTRQGKADDEYPHEIEQ